MTEALFELRESDDAFRRIEDWLHKQGFFRSDGEEQVADLYLEYGLSQAIRRKGTFPPREPCPALPLVTCRVREATRTGQLAAAPCDIGGWEPTLNDLSRLCKPGTVHWPAPMATRELAGVEHMVSTVEGELREGVGQAEILDATATEVEESWTKARPLLAAIGAPVAEPIPA